MKDKNNTLTVNVEALIAAHETASDDVVKRALEKAALLEKERQEKLILSNFTVLAQALNLKITQLQALRKEEKKKKGEVKAIGAAIEKFKKGKCLGDDFNGLIADLKGKGVYLH